jgi:hypothetical protein
MRRALAALATVIAVAAIVLGSARLGPPVECPAGRFQCEDPNTL